LIYIYIYIYIRDDSRVYYIYEFAGELSVIPINIWWLQNLGKN